MEIHISSSSKVETHKGMWVLRRYKCMKKLQSAKNYNVLRLWCGSPKIHHHLPSLCGAEKQGVGDAPCDKVLDQIPVLLLLSTPGAAHNGRHPQTSTWQSSDVYSRSEVYRVSSTGESMVPCGTHSTTASVQVVERLVEQEDEARQPA